MDRKGIKEGRHVAGAHARRMAQGTLIINIDGTRRLALTQAESGIRAFDRPGASHLSRSLLSLMRADDPDLVQRGYQHPQQKVQAAQWRREPPRRIMKLLDHVI